jgi:hypothetical protein
LEAFLPGKLGAVEASIDENSTVENRGRRETCPALLNRTLTAAYPLASLVIAIRMVRARSPLQFIERNRQIAHALSGPFAKIEHGGLT